MVRSNSINRILYPLFLLMTACQSDGPDISNIDIELDLKRLEKEIYSSKSYDGLLKSIDANREDLDLFYSLSSLSSDSVLANVLWHRIKDPSIDSFYQSYLVSYENIEWLESDANALFAHIKYYYPNFQPPKIRTMFSAYLDRDLVFDTARVIISLDFFLGPKAMYLPRIPSYMMNRYRKEYLVPMFLGLAYSQNYNVVNTNDRTLLSEMIFYGKSHFFASRMVPSLEDSISFGFSGSELKYIHSNIENIWAYLIERDLLFTTNFSEINRFVGERPKTMEIDPNCPGRIGRYLGFLMVEAYSEENPNLDFQSIMAEPDAQKIFRNSGFNPSKLAD
jgi:hypothetical protein